MSCNWERRQTEEAQQRRLESEERFREHLEELVEQRTRELEGSRAQLIQSQRLASVGTLAAGVAHQINNPIGSILASAEYALLYEDDAEISRRTILEEIVEQARRCGLIVRSVLQFSRNEATEKWREDLEDVVVDTQWNLTIRGAAFYEDEYRKGDDGVWRICRTGYKRTYEEIFPRGDFAGLKLTASWWGTGGRSELDAG